MEITGCSVAGNRARGFLIKSRNVLIEHNLIRESTGTGIHVGAEGSWHEGPASENVVIRYNRIIRCGTGAGTIAGTLGIAVHVGAPDATVPGLHKHILIEGNLIEGELVNGALIQIRNPRSMNVVRDVLRVCLLIDPSLSFQSCPHNKERIKEDESI